MAASPMCRQGNGLFCVQFAEDQQLAAAMNTLMSDDQNNTLPSVSSKKKLDLFILQPCFC